MQEELVIGEEQELTKDYDSLEMESHNFRRNYKIYQADDLDGESHPYMGDWGPTEACPSLKYG